MKIEKFNNYIKLSEFHEDINNQDFENDSHVTFYPSPAKDTLNINMGNITENKYTFTLIDMEGKEVLRKQIENAQLIESIPLVGLVKGIYLAILQTSHKKISKKIIVE